MTESTPSPAGADPPIPGSDPLLSPLEAAIALGITEDEVLIRRRRSELPARLSMADLKADVVLAGLRRP